MKRALVTVAGLLLALVLTLAVFGVDVRQGLSLIAEGAFGDKFGVARTLVRATPLVLCGLGMAIAWRAGMYNIGGEGQYVLGGLAGAWVAKALVGPAPGLANPAVLIAAALGGALFAGLAGWLQVRRGVQVVISTILLNFTALQALSWAVRGPLQEPKGQLPLTERLPDTVMFQRFDPQTDLHAGVFVAVAAVVLTALLLWATKAGYLLRLVGQNPRVARANRVDVGRAQIGAMLVSGGLCGLAGGVDYLGLIGQVGDGFSQNWGFLAIPVALLGGLDPLGVLASGLYFGALMAGGEGLARFNQLGPTLVYVIQAVAVLGLVALNARSRPKPVVDDD